MKMIEKISVSIPTMNRPDTLIDTLNSIYESEYYPEQIIIIDQSTGSLKEQVESSVQQHSLNECIDLIYVHMDQPSLTRARNKSLAYVKNDILVMMDDDVTIKVDTFQQISQIMEDDKIAMIAGLDEGNEIGSSKIGYLFLLKSWSKRRIGCVTKGLFGRFPEIASSRAQTEWAMGFFFVVRKSLLDKWNIIWDENFKEYAYAEDLDFSYRYSIQANREGLECIIDDRVKVRHNVSKEWRTPSEKHTRMMICHREYMSYKYGFSFLERVLLRWANIGLLIQRSSRKQKGLDVIKAQMYCDKNRKYIKVGKKLF